MNNQELQQQLIRHKLLDPPADGAWGNQSKTALLTFQKLVNLPPTGEANPKTEVRLVGAEVLPLNLGSDFASRVIKWMVFQRQHIIAAPGAYNIVYVEGVDKDGMPNADRFNEWNDRRLIIEIPDGIPEIVGNWIATTEPGSTYTYNPMNPGGAFRIAFGQYKAWMFGRHGRNQYPALVQCAEISGYRDKNKDGKRTGDLFVTGDGFGVNQHHGYDMEHVDAASAGCLVGRAIDGHWEFLDILKSDRRYKTNPGYVFYTTIIPGDELALTFPPS